MGCAQSRALRLGSFESHQTSKSDGILANTFQFFRQFLAHPLSIGAVSPSSRYLAREMVSWFELDAAKLIVEFGPGTGAFTAEVLKQLRPLTRFFTIEQNADFAHHMRQSYPSVTTYCDSVANVGQLCVKEGVGSEQGSVDGIICGLPWASFDNELQDELLTATVAALRPGGKFATFAYLQGTLLPAGMRFRRKLDERFANVGKSRVVWRNVPPAFIYRCTV